LYSVRICLASRLGGLAKNTLEQLEAWLKRFPEQVTRLSVIAILAVAALLAARHFLIPADFGKYGHYRASALDENAKREKSFAGRGACGECHEGETTTLLSGYHKNLSCEMCHGPGAAHIEAGGGTDMVKPQGRNFCPLCHEYSPSRPTGFPQIISASHNPLKPCVECHKPHDPQPPQTPKECSACHGEIWRIKAVSHHVNVPCTRCHTVKPDHLKDPRRNPPTKPLDRAFCGECHAAQAGAAMGAPQINVATHEPRYVCWQCHYPHLPEAR
jgi:hypothetical protein